MSEIALTILRLSFLASLWVAVLAVLIMMRRDLRSGERKSSRRDAVTASDSGRSAKSRIRRIVITTADDKVTQYQLVDNLTIGRGPDNVIVLIDDYASTHHAVISLTSTGWIFTDLGSTNGSWFERKRIEAAVRIKPGMTIRIGRANLRFEK